MAIFPFIRFDIAIEIPETKELSPPDSKEMVDEVQGRGRLGFKWGLNKEISISKPPRHLGS